MEVSRRDFLAGMTLGGAALASAMAVGCAPSAPSTASDAPKTSGDNLADTGNDLFAKPEPITDIAETKEADVLVLGAGTAGVTCALQAAQQGAHVVVMQKGSVAATSGVCMCALNVEEAHANNGLPMIDFSERILELNNANSGGSNFPLLKRFFENEVEAVTWFLNESKELGVPPAIFQNDMDSCIVYAPDGVDPVIKKMAEKAESLGVEFLYSTPAVQLVQDASGAVTGAIGQAADGSYVQVNASKGTVLATGDYSNNEELVDMWCPAASNLTFGGVPDRTGDGYFMANWVGAKLAPIPHAKMVHPVPFSISQKRVFWMKTDLHGNRVFPENLNYGQQVNALKGHPEDTAVQFFDSNYHDALAAMGQPDLTQEMLDGWIADGEFAWTADTLEELAQKAGLLDDADLPATVARWNELCEKGVDEDFFLDPKCLNPIAEPPFYAIKYQCQRLAIMGGMQVTADCACVDENDHVIPGLYAIGNAQGGFYTGTDYPFIVNGGSLGRCATFGYMVGRALANA